MNYYIDPWGTDTQFILKDDRGRKLQTIEGKMKWGEPIKLKHPPPGFPDGYPAYEAIVVKGVTEIIEHRKMEPLFYVTDDVAVWKQYLASGCD